MATWPAVDGSRTEVLAAIALASNGDTVTIPAGTWTWSSQLSLTKAITLQGSGIGQTIIRDGMGSSSSSMFLIDLVANQNTRIKDIEFNNSNRTNVIVGDFHIRAFGSGSYSATNDSRRIIIENCKFDRINATVLKFNAAYGVVANCIFNLVPGTYAFRLQTGGNGQLWADKRWSEANDFGSENFLFFETNTVTHDNGHRALTDGDCGGRFVFRYNTTTHGYVDTHGTESIGRERGIRAVEVYRNTFDDNDGAGGEIVNIRSGVALVHNNTATNWTGTPRACNVQMQRTLDSFAPWGTVDGINVWDNNTPGNPIETHTVTAWSGLTVTDSSATWDVDEWKGYFIRKTTAPNNVPIVSVDTVTNQITATAHGFTTGDSIHIYNHVGSTPHIIGAYTCTVIDANKFTIGVDITVAGTGGFANKAGSARNGAAPIVSNTETVITYNSSFSGASTDMQFNIGDTFEICSVDEIFDQPGRSGGTLISGLLPVPPASNDQTTDPIYEWSNTANGSPMHMADPATAIYSRVFIQGEHYINDTAKPGYSEYTYPHPLVSAATPVVVGDKSRARLRR